MITRHYKRIVKDILQRGGAKYDAYAVTASDGRPYYTAQEQPNYPADQTAMSMSTDQPGVIIGSGTAAESETSYWLQQQITSGFIGSVLPTHEMVDGTHTLCLYVTITNTGSSSITVSEIGYALITPLMQRPSDSQYIESPYAVEKNVLIDRTVLASPVTIAAGSGVRLKYALKTTDEIFSGSMVLIQKTINANGVYNASLDNANGYSEVTVSVTPNLQSKTATQNGTVTPDQGYDGLSSVVVDVSGGGSSVDPSDYAELFKYVCLSEHSGDKFIRSNRNFTRDTAEPILALCVAFLSGGVATYTGYAVISFTNSVISGTYTSYGDLTYLTAKTTPNGTPYWVQIMNGTFPTTTANNRAQFNVGNNQMYIYADVGGLVIDGDSKSLYGNADMISAMNALIDAIYLKYYAT